MLNGTSMASPQAAGAAALLVSAAKQTGAQCKPDAAAPGDHARRRGSWIRPPRRLRAGQRPDQTWRGVEPAGDEHQAPSRSSSSGAGQHCAQPASSRRRASASASTTARASLPGQSYTRTYTFTRTRAAAAAEDYNVRWVGNDGTFSSSGIDRSAAERAGRSATSRSTRRPRRPLGDPEPRRPSDCGHRLPDDEHVVDRAEQFSAGQQLHGHEDRHDRSQRST